MVLGEYGDFIGGRSLRAPEERQFVTGADERFAEKSRGLVAREFPNL